LKGYLFAIARNHFIKHQQRSNKDEQLPEELVDGSPDPHRAVAARMDLDRVTRALSRMPSSDRLALVLRTEHSLPYEEIARVLEISVGAARVKVYRARRRLLARTMNHDGGE
jgi:RNA polymerase sigma factor (sigma-70 family)